MNSCNFSFLRYHVYKPRHHIHTPTHTPSPSHRFLWPSARNQKLISQNYSQSPLSNPLSTHMIVYPLPSNWGEWSKGFPFSRGHLQCVSFIFTSLSCSCIYGEGCHCMVVCIMKLYIVILTVCVNYLMYAVGALGTHMIVYSLPSNWGEWRKGFPFSRGHLQCVSFIFTSLSCSCIYCEGCHCMVVCIMKLYIVILTVCVNYLMYAVGELGTHMIVYSLPSNWGEWNKGFPLSRGHLQCVSFIFTSLSCSCIYGEGCHCMVVCIMKLYIVILTVCVNYLMYAVGALGTHMIVYSLPSNWGEWSKGFPFSRGQLQCVSFIFTSLSCSCIYGEGCHCMVVCIIKLYIVILTVCVNYLMYAVGALGTHMIVYSLPSNWGEWSKGSPTVCIRLAA